MPALRLSIGLRFMEEMRQLNVAALRARHAQRTEEQVSQALREFVRHGAS